LSIIFGMPGTDYNMPLLFLPQLAAPALVTRELSVTIALMVWPPVPFSTKEFRFHCQAMCTAFFVWYIKPVFYISLNEFWTVIQKQVMVFAMFTKAGIKSPCPATALATGASTIAATGTVTAAGPVTTATGLISAAGTLSAATTASSASLSRTAASTTAGLGGMLRTS
jgi:hypothetical protein